MAESDLGMDWLPIVDVSLTVVGFAITFIGLWRTRAAIRETQARLASNQLLLLIPQLSQVEGDLDRAAEDGDRKLARHAFLAWNWQAGQIRALIPEGDEYQEVRAAIRDSIVVSTTAKGALIDSKRSVVLVTREARASISSVTGSMGAVAAKVATRAKGK